MLRRIALLFVLAALAAGAPRSAAGACCADRDGNGSCEPTDDAIPCRAKRFRTTFPIVCPLGDSITCDKIVLDAPSISIASTIQASRMRLVSRSGAIDLSGASLTLSRLLRLSAATDVVADAGTTIQVEPVLGRPRSHVVASANGAIDLSGATVVAGSRLIASADGGGITAAGGTYRSESGALRLSAPRGAVDVAGSVLQGSAVVDVTAGTGLSGAGSTIEASGSSGRVDVRLLAGSADLAGAAVSAERAVDIEATSRVGQSVILAGAQVRTVGRGDVTIETTGSLDVSSATLEANYGISAQADLDFRFRDPLVGVPTALNDFDGAALTAVGLPGGGPHDTVELVSDPFVVPADVDALSFDYAFLTNEQPFGLHNDTFVAYLVAPGAETIYATVEATRSRPASLFPDAGFLYWTGQFVRARIDLRSVAGLGVPVQVVFAIEDVGDSVGGSTVLLDNLVLRDRKGVASALFIDFENGDFTGFTPSVGNVDDAMAAVVLGIGDVDRAPFGNFPGPEDSDLFSDGQSVTLMTAPQGILMAVLATGREMLPFLQADGGTIIAP